MQKPESQLVAIIPLLFLFTFFFKRVNYIRSVRYFPLSRSLSFYDLFLLLFFVLSPYVGPACMCHERMCKFNCEVKSQFFTHLVKDAALIQIVFYEA